MSVEFLLTSFIVIISPGTGVLYTLAAGLSRGSRASVVAAFGCTVAFTAGSQLLFALERFSVATPTGGTQYTPMKHSSGSPASAVTDCRASTTVTSQTASTCSR